MGWQEEMQETAWRDGVLVQGDGMAERMSVAELLDAGIDALTHADAMQLESLATAARAGRQPRTAMEKRLVQERLCVLGKLITLTNRNLRLLRGTAGYGSLREGNSRG